MSEMTGTCVPRPSQGGFTLLEILIAILVLSIGVLGLAGLQFFGLQQGESSYFRSQASLLAYEMADRMRAENQAAAAGSFVHAASATPLPATTDCTTTKCTTADQLAASDLQEWDQRVHASLPSGADRIQCIGPCGAGLRQTITVMWDENRTGATGFACGTDPKVDLTCFTITIAP